METTVEYDPRYLAGIACFNRQEFFEAHEVWEDLWGECGPENRRFYQGLIQAAVALHHWRNGNWRGARRLFHSGRDYMSAFPTRHLGLHVGRFWEEMEHALEDILQDGPPPPGRSLNPADCPRIELDSPPQEQRNPLPP